MPAANLSNENCSTSANAKGVGMISQPNTVNLPPNSVFTSNRHDANTKAVEMISQPNTVNLPPKPVFTSNRKDVTVTSIQSKAKVKAKVKEQATNPTDSSQGVREKTPNVQAQEKALKQKKRGLKKWEAELKKQEAELTEVTKELATARILAERYEYESKQTRKALKIQQELIDKLQSTPMNQNIGRDFSPPQHDQNRFIPQPQQHPQVPQPTYTQNFHPPPYQGYQMMSNPNPGMSSQQTPIQLQAAQMNPAPVPGLAVGPQPWHQPPQQTASELQMIQAEMEYIKLQNQFILQQQSLILQNNLMHSHTWLPQPPMPAQPMPPAPHIQRAGPVSADWRTDNRPYYQHNNQSHGSNQGRTKASWHSGKPHTQALVDSNNKTKNKGPNSASNEEVNSPSKSNHSADTSLKGKKSDESPMKEKVTPPPGLIRDTTHMEGNSHQDFLGLTRPLQQAL